MRPGAQRQHTDLLERNLPETAAATDELARQVRPFEIVSIGTAPTAQRTTGLGGQTKRVMVESASLASHTRKGEITTEERSHEFVSACALLRV